VSHLTNTFAGQKQFMNILDKFQKIDTFMFDVDGVMTDGGILVMQNEDMARIMNTKDGYALQLAVKKGYKIFIITGSSFSGVQRRMNNLGVKHVYFEVKDKKGYVIKLMQEYDLKKENILFMGDDLSDLPAFDVVSIGACPADAVGEVISGANYISNKEGGRGCVRDVIEKVMKCRGDWGVDETIASTI